MSFWNKKKEPIVVVKEEEYDALEAQIDSLVNRMTRIADRIEEKLDGSKQASPPTP